MATVGDIAKAEKVTDRFVSRTMRLAFLSPDTLDRLLLVRQPPAVSWYRLVSLSSAPWAEQPFQVFS
jgi:hypothetical protein